MGDSLFALVVIAVLFGPPILLAMLKRTRLFWLPGAALLALACVSIASISGGHHDEAGVGAALADGILGVLGFGLLIYGVIILVLGFRYVGRAPRQPPPPVVELPPATVVSSVSKT